MNAPGQPPPAPPRPGIDWGAIERNFAPPARPARLPPPRTHPPAPHPAAPSRRIRAAKPPRCPYCRARAAAGTYGDAAAALPAYFCPRVPGPAACPYAGQPVSCAAPVTEAQRAQALEFEARRAAARRAAARRAIEEMAGGHPGLWTTASTILFLTPLVYLAQPPDEDGFHLPRWLLILLAGFLFALLTYLRERHLAARRQSWRQHLARPDKTTCTQTTTTAATISSVSHQTPMNTAFSSSSTQDS